MLDDLGIVPALRGLAKELGRQASVEIEIVEEGEGRRLPKPLAGYLFRSIKELLSTKALSAEGRAMKHCVASYARSCALGASSIWTMEVESFDGKRRALTVEVNNAARLICQARGKCNTLPNEKERGILRRWAETQRLRLACYV